MTTDDDMNPLAHLSWEAMSVMGLLLRRGGSLRIRPLIVTSRLSEDQLVRALDNLYERWWIDIIERGPHARLPETVPERFRPIRRVVATYCGRLRYPVTWMY